MGTRNAVSSLITILSFLIAFSSILFNPSEACGRAVYWGQNGTSNERSLQSACSSQHYEFINIAFLTNFGGGRQPVLNLTGHCDPATGTCRALNETIRFCQGRGIKVLLSLGGPSGDYAIDSPEDADDVASYIWLNFLSGNPKGPFGEVALDGVDFAINSPRSPLHWDDLAKALSGFSTEARKINLTAAPQCAYPDANLGTAIRTGVFDYVWVQFYNNPSCDISGGIDNLLRSWNEWSSGLPAGTMISIGLPADQDAAESGYVTANTLARFIIPMIYSYQNYGGMMLWNYYWDWLSTFSVQVSWLACHYRPPTNIKMIARN